MINMIKAMLMVGWLFNGLNSAGLAQMTDVKGSQDPALFTRMPNFKIVQYQDKQFDAYNFRVTQSGKPTIQSVEGHLTYWQYFFDKSTGAVPPSKLQIIRNYQAAAAKVGGQTVGENPNSTTLKISKDNKVIWVEVAPVPTGTVYALRIVEQQEMVQASSLNPRPR